MDPARTASRIAAAVRAIPPGRWAGYGDVARMAGLPGRARLVARVLSQDAGGSLPWHRVLRSDGRIAFPPGDPQADEQAARLRAEGIVVADGRVRSGRVEIGHASRDALDAALWGPG